MDFLDHSSLAAIACTERMAAELARPLLKPLKPLKPRWFLAVHGYGADRENTRPDKFGFDDDEEPGNLTPGSTYVVKRDPQCWGAPADCFDDKPCMLLRFCPGEGPPLIKQPRTQPDCGLSCHVLLELLPEGFTVIYESMAARMYSDQVACEVSAAIAESTKYEDEGHPNGACMQLRGFQRGQRFAYDGLEPYIESLLFHGNLWQGPGAPRHDRT